MKKHAQGLKVAQQFGYIMMAVCSEVVRFTTKSIYSDYFLVELFLMESLAAIHYATE